MFFNSSLPVNHLVPPKKSNKVKDSVPTPSRKSKFFPPPPSARDVMATESAQPSIDGPPSSERIREYTEQMRLNHIPSLTSSLRSGSSSLSGEMLKLSRTSSQMSNASKATSRGERPESVHIFGKSLFSRKKLREEPGHLRASSSLSTVEDIPLVPNYYNGRRKGSGGGSANVATSASEASRRRAISGPFNFQHVTHTQQDHLPNLARASRSDLLLEFSAMRASQAPTHGQLKGIRTQNLPQEAWSEYDSRYLGQTRDCRPRTSPQRSPEVPPKSPPQARRHLAHAQSHDLLRSPPPRPARSPLNDHQVIVPPPRTSSRGASMLWDQYNPLATTRLERPLTSAGFRKPKAFHLPISPPLPITRSDNAEDYFVQPTRSSPKSPEPESWPLASPIENPQLADVPEEEENRRRSRASPSSLDRRVSRSVPDFQHRPETPLTASTIRHGDSQDDSSIGMAMSPPSHSVGDAHQSWEDDIDYCYEHQADADFEYEWCRESMDGGCRVDSATSSQHVPPARTSNAETAELDARRFRHSLLVPTPSTRDVPDLSPISQDSVPSPDPRTPHLLHPQHLRSASRASSFKESHGFTLSPSLLIPSDFAAQMPIPHDDAIYDLSHDDPGAVHVGHQPYEHQDNYPISPVDTRSSTTSSFRSSEYGRASNGNTSLTTSTSQESVVLLARVASVALARRSISSSSSSLPDLIHSRTSKHHDVSEASAPTPEILLRKMPSFLSHEALPDDGVLSPVAEAGTPLGGRKEAAMIAGQCHGGPRPGIHKRERSAPLLSSRRECEAGEVRVRQRANSAAQGSRTPGRASYMLFPQI
ncbi:MAG: hypothetical protein M1818_000374 [Claussenomyces sp. TS43310]|nr:MAG: hypothetical protein M1818_000374 [Claussenomyces sp. TS43310]